jgi:hypothetical protein
MTLAQKIIKFNAGLKLDDSILPAGIKHLNPFVGVGSANIKRITNSFYGKYYSDSGKRRFIIGINPGRLGAGLTGVPFTDTIRLNGVCGIDPGPIKSYEPSSAFIYDVIDEMGGPDEFFNKFYIGSICPLGFVQETATGKVKNYNYYDRPDLKKVMRTFIVKSLRTQVSWGLERTEAYCLGTGQNYQYCRSLNEELGLFRSVIPLEHPRFIMQYRSKKKKEYIQKYIRTLS